MPGQGRAGQGRARQGSAGLVAMCNVIINQQAQAQHSCIMLLSQTDIVDTSRCCVLPTAEFVLDAKQVLDANTCVSAFNL